MLLESIPIGQWMIPYWVLLIISAWDIVWRAVAVMKSTKLNQPIWSVVFVLFQTLGILPILYIFIFSKKKKPSKKSRK